MPGKFFQKPDPEDQNQVPPGQHLAKGFPVLTYGETQQILPQDWQLKLWGEVETEKVLCWEDVMALPQYTFTADFHCVTRWSRLGLTWTGVKVSDLLELVTLKTSAVAVMQHSYGGYTTNLMLNEFIRPGNYLVHTLDAKPLSAEHGGPLRALVPHLYAWKSAKWLSGLEFMTENQPGFWERNGYHHRGDPWLEERYSV
jgi:DMSO/TMAO reductase YedYZ molybdopterin-dependent catalytic subunit